jgi:hypothetical protein
MPHRVGNTFGDELGYFAGETRLDQQVRHLGIGADRDSPLLLQALRRWDEHLQKMAAFWVVTRSSPQLSNEPAKVFLLLEQSRFQCVNALAAHLLGGGHQAVHLHC